MLPNRKPDFVVSVWEFYFKDMIQWNSEEEKPYSIRVDDKAEEIEFFSRKYEMWCRYDSEVRKQIYEAYLEWLIEDALLEGRCLT